MKKIFITQILMLLITPLCLAENIKSQPSELNKNYWTFIAKLNQITTVHNAYETSSGSKLIGTQSTNLNFLGLGISYSIYLNGQFVFFPELTVSKYLHNDPNNSSDLTVVILSGNLGYQIGDHQVFAGVTMQRPTENSELTFKPSIGARIGYSYSLDTHSTITTGFEFLTFKSENPAGNVLNQQTEMRSLMIAYGYHF